MFIDEAQKTVHLIFDDGGAECVNDNSVGFNALRVIELFHISIGFTLVVFEVGEQIPLRRFKPSMATELATQSNDTVGQR